MEDPDSASLPAKMEDPITASLGPMDRLLRRLRSFEASQHNLPEGVSEDKIKNLKQGLEGLYTYLKDFTPKWWMKEVRELCYDTEDYFDEVMQSGAGAGVRRCGRLNTIFRIISKRKRRPQTAKDFAQLMARVDDARGRCQSFQLAPETIKPDGGQAGVSPELPVPGAPISVPRDTGFRSIVGVEEPMDNLVKLLAFDDAKEEQLKVVPILGFPGVGKTTLARTLYHKFRGKFQCRAFLRISRNPDMRRLLTSMLSQIKAPPAHASSDAQDLIDNIIKHLQGKRYLIIIDDLWTASAWDIISRAFPYGDCCSRIITTTQIEDVALACCGYQSEYIFKMRPLNYGESRKLFFNRVFGSKGEGGCPRDFEEVSDEIIKKCGGLPLSTVNVAILLPSKPNAVIEQWEKVRCSLPSTVRTNPTSEGMKEVLNLIYSNLPPHLKTCLLYLSMYPEGCTIKKNELVKQWIAEGFVSAMEGIAGIYFDELVSRGMIQPVDTNYNGEVLSCTVNHMVMDVIRYKSMEENFVISVDYFQSTIGLPNKVRRLSVQFGGAKSAKIPESIIMSQVRSLLFCGFFKCVPSIVDYRLLRVLILDIWADQDKTSFDLSRIGELFRLRYLKIECNITVDLPDKIQGLQYLETLQVDAELSAVPSDIVHLRSLLHLRLPSEANLPHNIGHMTCLRTIGYFDICSNNVLDLGELTNLQDLHLTCSTLQPDDLKINTERLGLILSKLCSLKSLTLVPAASSHVNTLHDTGASSMSISCDGFSSVSRPPALLQSLELLPQICIFHILPKWIGELGKLCILKIAIRELSMNDINILKGLPALIALSLHVQTAPAERIVFGKTGFSLLRYFRFRCSVPWLKFEVDAMPNLQKLKLGFNALTVDPHGTTCISIECLSSLKEISAKIWGASADAESVLTTAVKNHPRNPKINVQLVNWNFYSGEGTSMAIKKEVHRTLEQQGEIQQEYPDECYRPQDNKEGDEKKRGCRIPVLPESSSRLPVPGMWMSASKRTTSSTTTGKLSTISTSTFMPSTVSGVSTDDGYPEGQILESPNLRIFTFAELKSATGNFRPETVLGEGRFGKVYKGWVDEKTMNPPKSSTGMVVAVKRLNPESVQGMEQWQSEVNFLGRISHPNLVKLLGYCMDDNELLLVYEFMAKGSLGNHLFQKSAVYEPLSWSLRLKILIGAARGIAFLHSSEKLVICRDFKASSILLDSHFNAKLSDFGLAKHGPDDGESHVTTRVMGTYGYLAPEYVSTGHLYVKSDIYGFGVVLLEMLSGLRALDPSRPSEKCNLVNWAKPLLSSRRKLSQLMDSRLGGQYPSRAALHVAQLTLKCLSGDPKSRPSMKEVVEALELTESLKRASPSTRGRCTGGHIG